MYLLKVANLDSKLGGRYQATSPASPLVTSIMQDIIVESRHLRRRLLEALRPPFPPFFEML